MAGHKSSGPLVLRCELGEMLRGLRRSRSMTLRDVPTRAWVSLGYLSEIGRGQKGTPSELLVTICYTLDAPINFVLREIADRIALQERVFVGEVSQTLPVGLLRNLTPVV